MYPILLTVVNMEIFRKTGKKQIFKISGKNFVFFGSSNHLYMKSFSHIINPYRKE